MNCYHLTFYITIGEYLFMILYCEILIICLFSGILQSVVGFGCGIVMMLFFPKFFGMVQGAAVCATVSLILTSTVAIKYKDFINWKRLTIPTISYMIASSTCILIVKDVNLLMLKLSFGIFLVFLSIYMFIFSNRIHFSKSIVMEFLVGIISGITSGLFAIGGPLIAVYYLNTSSSPEEFRGNGQTLFFITGLSGLVTRIANHIFTVDLIPITIAGMMGIYLGKVVGLRLAEKIDSKLTSIIVYSYILFSGIVTIIQSL